MKKLCGLNPMAPEFVPKVLLSGPSRGLMTPSIFSEASTSFPSCSSLAHQLSATSVHANEALASSLGIAAFHSSSPHHYQSQTVSSSSSLSSSIQQPSHQSTLAASHQRNRPRILPISKAASVAASPSRNNNNITLSSLNQLNLSPLKSVQVTFEEAKK